jgi:NAD(P)-dependent dehydrogenase (short-subunit alcohol dehydrogenase family)
MKFEEDIMVLADKVAVVYGGGGSIGGAVARTFAREGARVFLAGRTRDSLDAVAKDIEAAGGAVSVAVVDALDEAAVDAHLQGIVAAAGRLDISLNLASRGDVQGVPLVDMSVDDLLRPVVTGVTATFVTARAAARQMAVQGGGVILALNSGSAHGSPLMGGTGLADSAIDLLVRNLAAEVGPSGVRVLGIWTAGLPETLTPEKLAAVNSDLVLDEAALEGLKAQLAGVRMLRRSPTLAEIAETATFLASDRAGAITATWINATGGMFGS